ncbi:MAG: hypothetical protein KKG59_01665, partial [Nanoarchaeota archaeon]|nr:hypothetical protein [Nanoarchaeota archaeon]
IATMKGHSEIAKESKKGTKHFFQYQEEHIQNILVRHSFNTIWTRSYRQRDEEFIDFLFRK